MGKGADELPRGYIPELGCLIPACRQDPGTVRTKRRVFDLILMVKRGNQLAGGRIPKLGGFVPACRQDPLTVQTKSRGDNQILMFKGGDGQPQRVFTMDV